MKIGLIPISDFSFDFRIVCLRNKTMLYVNKITGIAKQIYFIYASISNIPVDIKLRASNNKLYVQDKYEVILSADIWVDSTVFANNKILV